eukprot:64655-Rhodomonas_salina.1
MKYFVETRRKEIQVSAQRRLDRARGRLKSLNVSAANQTEQDANGTIAQSNATGEAGVAASAEHGKEKEEEEALEGAGSGAGGEAGEEEEEEAHVDFRPFRVLLPALLPPSSLRALLAPSLCRCVLPGTCEAV